MVCVMVCIIHAREWISSATNQFFAQELVQRSESDADVKDLLNTFDFYILPVLNADGYEYTHTDNRMWRKTRQPNGTDPNRNFAYQWGGQGASTNACADTYRGTKAFSEPETKAVSDFVLSKGTKVKAYLAVHSYGQYWLYPWLFLDFFGECNESSRCFFTGGSDLCLWQRESIGTGVSQL
ncbi:unnamed protein product [Oppiella nova]|uniref:Peptidase M14 domain-containing protein n=1 Tax=Oppiella nova TaxID=334625 RepID=A0A7R9LFK9_9ACAR|nr:unnamed protein product [Oppiella nova]CAG2163161.1 unnamed protein product [Oppiella nova]